MVRLPKQPRSSRYGFMIELFGTFAQYIEEAESLEVLQKLEKDLEVFQHEQVILSQQASKIRCTCERTKNGIQVCVRCSVLLEFETLGPSLEFMIGKREHELKQEITAYTKLRLMGE